MHLQLRDYQQRAIDLLRDAMRAGNRRVVLAMPTGAGKSAVAEHVISSAIQRGTKVLFAVNRVQLVTQFSRRLHRAGIKHGIVQSTRTRNIDAQVLVASIATVAKRGVPDDVKLVIVDEAHSVPGTKAYRELLAHLNVPCIGLTATPWSRGMSRYYDDLKGPLFQSIVVPVTIRDLIDDGHLVDMDAWAPETPDMTGVSVGKDGDWVESQLDKVMNKKVLVGGIVEHWMRLAKDESTVVFASSIAHSQNIVEQFKLHGVSAEHIDCHTSDGDRQAILERLEKGYTKVVSNCAVLAEGFDEPRISCMVLARPTRSLIRMVQMVGRALRPYPGKTRALILDHSGSMHRFPWLTDPLPMDLDDGRPKETKASQKGEEEEKVSHSCPVCHYVKRPGVWTCPKCGHTPHRPDKVTVKAGELKKLSRKNASSADKQAFWSQLMTMRKEKNYSHGWASHKYKEFFGVWPQGMQDIPAPVTDETRRWIKSRNIAYHKGKIQKANIVTPSTEQRKRDNTAKLMAWLGGNDA